ncbi:hypothetical protein AAFC00_006462 [Neodothiora populina]|uniref:RNB domain-containing protein n=1 Tax=Neodothiora populina TaxID=2781224 RepID=A0ABR3P5J2_9PEZI
MLSVRTEASRRSQDFSTVCWSCAIKQQRLYSSSLSRKGASSSALHSNGRDQSLSLLRGRRSAGLSNRASFLSSAPAPSRSFNTSATSRKQIDNRQTTTRHSDPALFNPSVHSAKNDPEFAPVDVLKSKIRQQLKIWNDEHGSDKTLEFPEGDDMNGNGEMGNDFTRLSDTDNFKRPLEAEENERDDISAMTQAKTEDIEDFDPQHRFLTKGDLVELEFLNSEREAAIAVFVRRVGTTPPQAQFYTVNGKWIHMSEKAIQYAIPGLIDPKMLDPILPYLPDQEVNDELLERAQLFDLSVPRDVSAPLVSRMLRFQRESDEIYRKNARSLDDAHDILAHHENLQFGSLEQVASQLLKGSSKSDDLKSAAALFTVRKALARAGFAFGTDRRSHRLTGFIQIRPKKQVATVEKVRNWIREWQDALASSVASKQKVVVYKGGARSVNNFILKARGLVEESRKTRQPTTSGRVSTGTQLFPITQTEHSYRSRRSVEFDADDRELIKFLEGWSCSNLFMGLPRVAALPPLILQATGMYNDYTLSQKTGYLFLQEIGVLVPWENRVRHDQHLLLPTSQHSKPLSRLDSQLQQLGAEDDPGLVDSMSELRKDWGDLAVFCIDGEGAHEIDDGLSVEKSGEDFWVHIHIANPTAFFDPEHPLATMSRHLTESIYMPERAYMMLPSWATKRYFSLTKNRPCLTFSAKMNAEGETLELKVTPGLIRNVHQISPDAVAKAIGVYDASQEDDVLTVGGQVPHSTERKTGSSLKPEHVEMLRTMQDLAEKRQKKRREAGGLFLDSHRADVSVWSGWNRPGLGWDHPSHHHARFIDGEPVIQYRSKQLISWFSTGESVSDILVQEMMLLCCEIGAQWSAERNIPAIYRGTIPHPYAVDPEEYYRDVMEPAMAKNGGEAPMHLAVEYLRSAGTTILNTTPLPHKVLGLNHYSKVTSPLRRYGDMVLHWQIEAALRKEAETGKSLLGNKSEDFLPFNTASLNHMATSLHPREMIIRRATRYSEDFWITQLFFRAFYYGECELPKTFHAYLGQRPQTQIGEVAVILKEYSLPCAMWKPDLYGLSEAKAGDWWEVEILEVDCFFRKIVMKPLRLISRWE